MRRTYTLLTLVVLLWATTAAAAPDWSTYEFPYSASDATGDGSIAPAPPGADIDTLSFTTEDGLLYVHLSIAGSLPASGEVLHEVDMDVAGTVYTVGARVVRAAGEVVAVAASGSVGTPSWDEATAAIVWEVAPSAIGNPSNGAVMKAFSARTGPGAAGAGCTDCYDMFDDDGPYTFGTGAPTPAGNGTDAPEPPMPVVWRDLTGDVARVEIRHGGVSSVEYRYNWTTEDSLFTMDLDVTRHDGEIQYEVMDGNGTQVAAGTVLATFQNTTEIEGVPGNWTIRVVADGFQGMADLVLTPRDAPAPTTTTTTTSSPAPTTTTTRQTTTSTNGTADPDEDSPSLGFLFSAVALVGIVAAVRRRL